MIYTFKIYYKREIVMDRKTLSLSLPPEIHTEIGKTELEAFQKLKKRLPVGFTLS